jgi:hypothetical protein
MMADQSDGFATRHNQDCSSNFGAMVYDSQCARCQKINKVIMLRRKNVRNGCSQQESIIATAKATSIIETYKLTRGEIYDREYDSVMIAKRTDIQQATQKRKRSKMSQYERKTDESQLF